MAKLIYGLHYMSASLRIIQNLKQKLQDNIWISQKQYSIKIPGFKECNIQQN